MTGLPNAPRIGVVVVGAGYWGTNLVRNFQASSSFRLLTLCDVDEDRARRVLGQYSTVVASSDVDTVLADPAVAAVAIATPADTHSEIALAALRGGKHVLVEKPLAATSADGLRLVAAAAERGLTLMCDHTYCYTPAADRIRSTLSTGDLGELRYLDAVRVSLGPMPSDTDVVWDLAARDLSIVDYVMPVGTFPLSVSAHGADPMGTGHVTVAYVAMKLNTGAMAHVRVNSLSPIKRRTLVVGGSKQTLLWDDLNPAHRLAIFDHGVDVAVHDELDADERSAMMVSHRSGDMIVPALAQDEALTLVVREFADAIRGSRPARTDGLCGLRLLRMLEAATESLAAGGVAVRL